MIHPARGKASVDRFVDRGPQSATTWCSRRCGRWTFSRSEPSVGSLHEAIALVAQHEFDAIVLGPKVADAWPTAAYEQIANLAGTTTVVVQTDYLGPMTTIKQRHGREQDVIVANAEPSLLARLILAAILRRRALAEQPGAQIG